MKKLAAFVFVCIISFSSFSQGPGEPFYPMTTKGSTGIWPGHTLHWENPPITIYNKIYFSEDSSLVISMDTSALIYNGYPFTTYSSISLSIVGSFEDYKRYYWKVVEYDSSDFTIGETWYFISRYSGNHPVNEDFSDGLQDWEMIGPNGIQNWFLSYSSFAGGDYPELSFSWSPTFIGQSFIVLDMELVGEYGFEFKHFVDWYSNLFTIGFGYLTDSGNTWVTHWEITPTGNIGPETITGALTGNYDGYRIGFYFSGNSSNINSWFIDDVILDGPLTPPTPPYYLEALSDTSQLKIYLTWQNGSCGAPIVGYEIKRKDGLPLDTTNYYLLTVTDETTFNYIDENILPNKIYTYKIRTLCGPANHGSMWSNEATAYVPDIPTSTKTTINISMEFFLEQNFPNPFNPTTKIKYQIPEVSFVTLKIYNVLGKEVATLINEEKPARSYEVEWDASGLPSGIYFYKLRSGNFVETKKMVLLR